VLAVLSVGVLSYALASAFGGWCSLIRAGCAFGWNLIYFDDLQIFLFGRLAGASRGSARQKTS